MQDLDDDTTQWREREVAHVMDELSKPLHECRADLRRFHQDWHAVKRRSTHAPAHWPCEAELIAELKATFPGIQARPLAEFRHKSCQHGVWTGGDATMADGEAIFSPLSCNDPDYYDGQVHRAFAAWLARRGWFVENYDGQVFFIRSKAEDDDDCARLERLHDLREQLTEAKIGVHRMEAMVALERAQIGDLSDPGDAHLADQDRRKAAEHIAAVLRLREERRGYLHKQAPIAPGNESPF